MYTPELKIADRLNELDCTSGFIAALYGLSHSRVASALRGDSPFRREDADGLLNLTQKLIELRDSVAPIPLRLSNATEIRTLLDKMKREYIESADIRRALDTIFNSSGNDVRQS